MMLAVAGHRSGLTLAAAIAMCVAAGTLVAAEAMARPAANLRLQSVPEMSGRPVNVSKSLLQRERQAVASGQSRNVSVIVRLQDDALASYRGSVAGLNATAPRALGTARLNARSADSQRYIAYLNSRQQAFAAQLQSTVPTARVVHRFQIALNGMAVMVPESRISSLAALPGVAAIYEDPLLRPTTDASPAFINAPALWTQLGGQGNAGEGAIIGVLDSGVWPEHPSFADPDASGKPYGAPPGPARACQFSGGANPGAAFTCNNKLIGAHRFMATYDALVGLLPTEYTSARDDNGHGNHTATTAGGNRNVPASIFERSFGIVSGVAPRAQVIAYKVCGEEGCMGSDSVAAVNQAILDGVDVINFSISGGEDPYFEIVSLAFLNAYEAGLFVAASAGNDGPGANTVAHREPWTTTVAASTSNRQFQSALTLSAAGGASTTLYGASVTPGLPTPAPVHVPVGDPFCASPFAPGSVAGKVVVCQRGVNARVVKSYNVSLGGAVAMILYNLNLEGLATDNHFLPSVHLENNAGTALKNFLAANTGVTAALTAGTATSAQGDVLAPFSSRGGNRLSLGIGKPDITAPGVQILAGASPTPATREGGAPGQLFQSIQGTSMSSPHVAGAAALLKALHPAWTPGQIKSALMTTANGIVYREDAATLATPFDTGSGRIDLAKAGDPGLLFDETGANFVALQSQLWNANYPSLFVPGFLGQISVERTVQNTRTSARDWKLSVVGPTDLKITVPNTISVPALGSATFRIDVDGSAIPVGEVRHAVIELSRSNEATLRFPVTVVRSMSTAVPLAKSCAPLSIPQNTDTDCTITLTNTTFAPATVSLIDSLTLNRLQLVSGSVVNATQVGNSVQYSGVLGPAQPPSVAIGAGTSPAGYLPLSLFGVTPVTGMGDESLVNFNVPPFLYATEVYTRIGISSNGYVVVGGGSGPDNLYLNQSLPNATRPNNVLAPFWTDLNPGAAGAVRVGILTDGADSWLVVEWEGVREYSADKRASFQIWIGASGDAHPGEDISFAYGAINGNGDGGLLTVGAENRFGNRGQNFYFNGTGTLPTIGTELRVTSAPGAPGESRSIMFSAKGKNSGPWTNCARLTSDAFFGTQTACLSGVVTK